MSYLKAGACAVLAAAVSLPVTTLASKHSATSTDTIDQRIHDYIMNNPKVLVDSLQKYQADMRQKAYHEQMKAAINSADKLRNTPYNTIAGNPTGSVTLVEFFDYQCIMCYRVYKDVDKLIDKNKNLRVVFRLLPIFGKASGYAAKVDIAAAMQGKYATFHDLMFKAKRLEGKLTNKDVNAVAKQAGVSLSKSVMAKVSSKQGKAFLAGNLALAKALRISGTPAFFIMPTKGTVTKQNLHFFGGVAPIQYLQKAIDVSSGKKPETVAADKKKALDNKTDDENKD